MKKLFTLFALCSILALFGATAQASLIYQKDSHKGDFEYYNDTFEVSFTISEAQEVWIYTDSFYNSGQYNGLDTGLILWDSDNNFIVANEYSRLSSVTHELGVDRIASQDAAITIYLEPGTYTVSVVPFIHGMQIDNQRYKNLQALLDARAMLPNDLASDRLSGTGYSLHIVYAPSAVPVPASALLLAPGLAAIGMLRRKLG